MSAKPQRIKWALTQKFNLFLAESLWSEVQMWLCNNLQSASPRRERGCKRFCLTEAVYNFLFGVVVAAAFPSCQPYYFCHIPLIIMLLHTLYSSICVHMHLHKSMLRIFALYLIITDIAVSLCAPGSLHRFPNPPFKTLVKQRIIPWDMVARK